MNVNHFLNRLVKKTKRNSPEIMTALAAAGVVGTAVLSAKGAFQAAKKLHNEDADPWEQQTFAEKAKIVWPEFVPAAIVGGTTVACVIGSHRVHTRRTAAAVAAYSLTERAFAEYRDKVQETLGKNKAEKVEAAVAEQRMRDNPVSRLPEVVLTTGGESLCYDMTSGRYFQSDMQTLKAAMNRINERLIKEDWMSVKDFYLELGVYVNDHVAQLGWTLETGLMDLVFTPTLADNDQPCLAFTFNYVEPIGRKARS